MPVQQSSPVISYTLSKQRRRPTPHPTKNCCCSGQSSLHVSSMLMQSRAILQPTVITLDKKMKEEQPWLILIFIKNYAYHVVPHPRVILQCGTVRRYLSLFLKIILIVPHPLIVPRYTFVFTFSQCLDTFSVNLHLDLKKELSW